MKKYVRLFAVIVVLAAFALMALGSGSDSEEVKAPLLFPAGMFRRMYRRLKKKPRIPGSRPRRRRRLYP